ncbi:hypothetical protein [Roseobacter sp.]|uniref:hypothetical protein n=1 Tax=Roseobacter sp. TaxID=1907202 RepID=UPI0025E844F1|nr:hypothetical protein [Roseobacter sp.]
MSFRKIIVIVALAVTVVSVSYDLAARPAGATGGSLTADSNPDPRRDASVRAAGADPA